MKKKINKFVLSFLFLGVLMIPSIASAEIKAIECPVYGGTNHKSTNKVYLRQESVSMTHSEKLSSGATVPCTVTKYYKVYRNKCACGVWSANGEYKEYSHETHKLQ